MDSSLKIIKTTILWDVQIKKNENYIECQSLDYGYIEERGVTLYLDSPTVRDQKYSHNVGISIDFNLHVFSHLQENLLCYFWPTHSYAFGVI